MAEKLEEDTSVCDLQGTFTVKKVKHTVSLTNNNLSWRKSEGKKQDDTSIPVMDIVAVNAEASKSSKTGTVDCWVLIYAQRKKKNHLRRAEVTFCGDQTDCQHWTNKIQQLLDKLEQRPKKSLVFVNPVSGWKKGEKEYKTKVAPLFAEAKIQTDVRVTERAHQPEEILETYDLTSIDSIVAVGGDGIYCEVVNGILKRIVKDSNINLNESNFNLPQVGIPIGVIPCGTGNGVAETNHGCSDVETAALSIIIGKRNNCNVDTVHCAGEFVIFSALLIACGFWGDLIHHTERRRDLGVFRYPIIMLNHFLLKSQRVTTLNIQYKALGSNKTAQEQETKQDTDSEVPPVDNKTQSEGTVEEEAASHSNQSEEWITVEKDFIGPISFNVDFFGASCDNMEDSSSKMTILAIKPCTRMQILQFMGRMIKRDLGAPVDYVDHIVTTEYKVKVVNPSDPSSETRMLEHLLDLDGEVVQLKHPEYSVRHFPKILQVFANVPEDYLLTIAKSRK